MCLPEQFLHTFAINAQTKTKWSEWFLLVTFLQNALLLSHDTRGIENNISSNKIFEMDF